MPPRTDCSAGMSWGGFRLPSDPRVPSIVSRCATDKTAVLRCVPWRTPAMVKAVFPSGAADGTSDAHPSGQVYLKALTTAAGPRAQGRLWAQKRVIPNIHRLSTEVSATAGYMILAVVVCVLPHGVSAPPKQVFRYASRPFPKGQARSSHGLWITCALRGIACAQPVGDPVETKKV